MDSFHIPSLQKHVIFLIDIMKLILDNCKSKQELTKHQNLLSNFEATNMILSILSDRKFKLEFDLFLSLLNFGIKLLENGNSYIQKNIFNYFISYPRSELIFKRIHHLIANSMKSLRDHTSSSETDKNDSEIMERCMRFLQLLAEGHNLNLQKYLKLQTESKKSYDMISLTVELLITYFECGTVDMFDPMINTIDMLIEFVQGPCEEN